MDTKTGEVIIGEEMAKRIANGRDPKGFIELEKVPDGKEEIPEHPAFKPRAGAMLDFGNGVEARIDQVGSVFMKCKLKGKRSIKPEMLDKILTLGESSWRIISTGKVFRLQKMEVVCKCGSCARDIYAGEKRFKNKDKSYNCGACVEQMILGDLKSKSKKAGK